MPKRHSRHGPQFICNMIFLWLLLMQKNVSAQALETNTLDFLQKYFVKSSVERVLYFSEQAKKGMDTHFYFLINTDIQSLSSTEMPKGAITISGVSNKAYILDDSAFNNYIHKALNILKTGSTSGKISIHPIKKKETITY